MRYSASLLLLILWVAGPSISQDTPRFETITQSNVSALKELGRFGRGIATSLQWHPTSQKLAVGSATGVWLLDQTLQNSTHTPVQFHVTDLAWSPDGRRIAVVGNVQPTCVLQVWDADFTYLQIMFNLCGGKVSWNSDGTYLAIFDQDNAIEPDKRVTLVDLLVKLQNKGNRQTPPPLHSPTQAFGEPVGD